MIEDSLNNLFSTIECSDTYKEYMRLTDIVNTDLEIVELINDIKKLERRATYLQNAGNNEYKNVDLEIGKKMEKLNNNHIYQEYLIRKEEFNDEMAASSKIINDYIKEKV